MESVRHRGAGDSDASSSARVYAVWFLERRRLKESRASRLIFNRVSVIPILIWSECELPYMMSVHISEY